MNIDKLKELLRAALSVVEFRSGDISTEDGSFATTSIDEIIRLESAFCDAFETESDDATFVEINPQIERIGQTVLGEISQERCRQMNEEGFTIAHDDEHDPGELSGAGAAYALHAACELHPIGDAFDIGDIPPGWCWEEKWFKPKDARNDLIKAAALIVAEIEKIDRFEKRLRCTKGG